MSDGFLFHSTKYKRMENFQVTSEVPFAFYCDSVTFGSSVLNIMPVQSIINIIIIIFYHLFAGYLQ